MRESSATELIDNWRAGRQPAVGEIYARYYSSTLEHVRIKIGRQLRAVADSTDVVQAVFLRVLDTRAPEALATEAELLAYLRTSVLNQLRDLHRHHARVKRDHARDERFDARPGLLERLPSPHPTQSQIACGGETYEKLMTAIEELPDSMRDAIYFARFEELTSEIAAERMGLPSAEAFRKLLSRALARVMVALEQRGTSMSPDSTLNT